MDLPVTIRFEISDPTRSKAASQSILMPGEKQIIFESKMVLESCSGRTKMAEC